MTIDELINSKDIKAVPDFLAQLKVDLGQIATHARGLRKDIGHTASFARSQDFGDPALVNEIESIDYEAYCIERVLFRLLPTAAGAKAVEPVPPSRQHARQLAAAGRFHDTGEDRF